MVSIDASERAYAAIAEKIQKGEPFVAAPQGTSMYPFFIAGRDRVLLTPLTAHRTPRRGDVVLYRRLDGLLVLHRLHHRDRDGCYFVGDNQTELEGPLEECQMLATVTRIYRGDRSFSPCHPVYLAASRLWLLVRPFRHLISRSVKRALIFLRLYPR